MADAPDRSDKAADPPARRWSFGPAVLDERTLELAINGESVSLERKPLEVLLFLLHHAGEVVTKDEILEAVWPGRILSDSALTSCIHRVREVLGDEEQALIKTQHGYGYRLIAPVQVEASATPPPPRFDFKSGDSPPLRPRWKLEECLGTGGHGEAWRARHEKTREVRVYKFALDSTALGSLKREITIYRLLHDALPERTDFVSILDWNLEEPPYFLEIEHAGLNLVDWAESQGGLPNVPLETRLEIAAQIAEALAAAHSVGVLHKDLKPSNVLIASSPLPLGEGIGIKLSDFGSGGVLDPGRLEALGITRLGFTKTVKTEPTTSGTPIYFAPEVIAGQPFTVQADIYALGVMLYQLTVGEIRKPLAHGWEQEVTNEFLREDIADAVAGNPGLRVADAALIGQRLRSLDQRRSRRATERAAQEELERARAAAEEQTRRAELSMAQARARRRWVRATIGALAVGFAASTVLSIYALRARDEARLSTDTAQAVGAFLNEDVLGGFDPDKEPVKDIKLKDLLDRAATTVDHRFAARPQVAAEVHFTLGRSYLKLQFEDDARRQYERAIALLEQMGGGDEEKILDAKKQFVDAAGASGAQEVELLAVELLRHYEEKFGPLHEKTMRSRGRLAEVHWNMGRYRQAADGFRRFLTDFPKVKDLPEEYVSLAKINLGQVLVKLAEYEEAEQLTREAMALAETLSFPQRQIWTAMCRASLGALLVERGRYEEAEALILSFLAGMNQWFGAQAGIQANANLLAFLRMEQTRYDEAIRVLNQIKISDVSKDEAAVAKMVRSLSANIFQRQGRLAEAKKVLREGLAASPPKPAAGTEWIDEDQLLLADILREEGRTAEAWEVLNSISPVAISNVPDRHPLRAELHRVKALLWRQEGLNDRAQEALKESGDIYESRLGPNHWRTKRAREELARVPAASAAKAAGRS